MILTIAQADGEVDEHMVARLRERVMGLIDTIERAPISIGRWILILAAIIALRHFLEQVSGQLRTIQFLSYFVHYPLAYITPLLALSVVLAAMARERIERVTKLMLFAWLLTLLPPLVDLLLTGAGQQPELIGYLIPKNHTLTEAFINLLNPFYHGFQGTTAGIRIEAAAGCVLAAVYVQIKTGKLARALLTAVLVYPTMFVFFTLPSITLAVTRLFGSQLDNVYQLFFARADVYRAFADVTPFALSDLSNSLIDLILIVPLLGLWYRMYSPEGFRDAVRSIDPVATFCHVAATAIGIVLAARLLMGSRGLVSVAHAFDVIALIGLTAAAFFTAQAATAMRLLFSGSAALPAASRDRVSLTGMIYVTLALLFSLSVSYVALTYVVATLSIYFLYYAPPLRLSRYTPLASFMMGAVALFALSLGYSAYAGEQTALWLPKGIVALALLVPTLGMLSRDIWQSRDEGRGRWDLVVLLGEGRARALAGIALLIAALLPALLLRAPVLAVPAVIVGGGALLLLLRGQPNRVPGGLVALALVLVVAGFATGVTDSILLRQQLASTSFADVMRRGGNFEFMQKADATEEQGLVNEGILLFRSGDMEGAIEFFRRAIEIKPEYVHAYVSLGSAQLRIDQLEAAERSFRRALEFDDENALAYLGLGQTYELFGSPDEAIRYVERALELDPESADATFTLALIYAGQAEHEREFEALTRTVGIDPQNSQAYSRLADIFLANRMYPEATRALNAAAAGRIPVEHIHTRLAEAHYSMGDLERAESELRREISLRPRSASARASLARVLDEVGRTEESISEWKAAIDLTANAQLRSLFEAELAKLTN